MNAVADISRCQRTSQATVSVSASVRPSRGQSAMRHLGAELAMVAAAPLGDVVEQHRDVERAARGDLPEQARWRADDRPSSSAALDPREQADRADRMLVDRIMMVHVELHLGDDAAEIGNEAAEHAGLVHPAQHRLGIARAGQHVEEQARWRADRRGPRRRSAWRRGRRRASPAGGFRGRAVGEREHLDQPHRILRRGNRRRGRRAGRGRA